MQNSICLKVLMEVDVFLEHGPIVLSKLKMLHMNLRSVSSSLEYIVQISF